MSARHMGPELMCKFPESTSLANRMAQSTFCVKIPALSPNLVLLAKAMASSMSEKGVTATAGPNSSSREMRISGFTSATIVAPGIRCLRIDSATTTRPADPALEPMILVASWVEDAARAGVFERPHHRRVPSLVKGRPGGLDFGLRGHFDFIDQESGYRLLA